MHVAAIIVNYRTPQLVVECLEALSTERVAVPGLRAIVVDNASGDDSLEILPTAIASERFADWVEFVPLGVNGGFGWGNNQAILHLLRSGEAPEAFYLLNPDASVEPGALKFLVATLSCNPQAAAVGSQLLNHDGSLCGSAFRFPTVAHEFMRGLGISLVGKMLGIEPILVPYGVSGPVDWVTGASVLLRTEALRECGLFDTGFFLYFEEVELMHRFARHGWTCLHCAESRVKHFAGASTGVVDGRLEGKRVPPDYVFQSRLRFFALTGGRTKALLANLAWMAGDAIATTLSFGGRGRKAPSAPGERAALIRNGLRAPRYASEPASDQLHCRAGGLPAWMRH